ncbi:DUF2953 domain-containing protein [Caldicoprobacter algeriensis]|nr:DUF2953 domain-containing protein [Caldicoprobacter algeriensis]
MALYVWIILAVLILLVLISMVTVRIEIGLRIKNCGSGSFIIVQALGGLVRRKVSLAMKPDSKHPFFLNMREPSVQDETAISPQEIISLVRKGLRIVQQNAQYFKTVKDKVKVEDFEVMARLGTGDAAHTALLCGSLLSLLHIALFHLQNKYYLEKKRVNVTPVFDREDFELNFNCIIALKLRYIIIAGMQKKQLKK